MSNKKTKLMLLLAVLSDHDWHEANELVNQVCWRFGATIYEARHKGYPIETEPVSKKRRYRLLKS